MSTDTHQQQHEMQLEKTHPSGAEEWFCPTCGRRFVVKWQPAFERVILEVGDQHAAHSGSKGGLRLRPPQISESEEEKEPVLSDDLCTALEEILANVDLDSWPSTTVD
jgi:hypothetical protein